MAQSNLELATMITVAFIEKGDLQQADMPNFLSECYNHLNDVQNSTVARPDDTPNPPIAQNWRSSITRHTVSCLECGQQFKQLSVRHLSLHDLNPRSYRVKYNIPRTQPLAAKSTTARRREVAQDIRPWEKTPRFIRAQAEAHAEEEASVNGVGTATATRKRTKKTARVS